MRGCFCDGKSIGLRTDLPEPVPADGEVRLKVRRVGICDTDIQLARGYMGFRGILGHEFVAETEDGRRVTAEINNACHRCPTCLAGRPGHCPNRTVLGIFRHDGAMADLVCVPERNLHAIPDHVPDELAVFVEPLAAAFRIAEQVDLDPSVRLAILGDGKLGLLCAWATRLTGARVELIGKHPAKLALAGPGIAVHSIEEAETLAHIFDVVVDCTGSPSGLAGALELVRPCGTVVLKTTVAGDHSLNLAPAVVDEVRIVGSRCGPFSRAIAALAVGEVDVRPLIEAEYGLNDVEEAFRVAGRKGTRKVILAVV
jgi:threonine dehydrogenase-like Zn-dependent dehydrogenase